jgi:hypothetical protein
VAGRENHTLDFAVTDPQHIHEEMDHAYATFHQLTSMVAREMIRLAEQRLDEAAPPHRH